MTTHEPEPTGPPDPETIEQTGLAESLIEQLIVKILYFRGEVYGQDLSAAIGLKFSVIQDLVETLKLQHLVQVKRSLGMGSVGALLALTEAGRSRAREHLEANQYAGPAPVPLSQYVEIVRRQRPRERWLTKETLARTFEGKIVTERLLSQLGPAVSSSQSLLMYGRPGDGKTFLIESLANLDTAPIFVPYAIECQGNIVQLFDPIYHHQIAEDEPSVLTVSAGPSYDRRWTRCKRPFIVSGGELSMDMLDLRYNATSKIYEAPFQLKANNGIYLVDDFGRQRATPAEVLNRWIVPMERRVDYLSFLTGGKMTVPFETFLVFSTNLNPADLGDEAFLRRIQYKMLLRGPAENEFIRIFETFCATRGVPCSRDVLSRFIDKYYKRTGKAFRRCHPRDVITHAVNLVHFERLPAELTDALLDRAFESCFVQEQQDAPPAETPIVATATRSCADSWGDKVVRIPTVFGTLAFAASFRDPDTGKYFEAESARQHGEAETASVLARQHTRAFRDWLSLGLSRQNSDLKRYVSTTDSTAAKLAFEQAILVTLLTPPDAKAQERLLFASDLRSSLQTLCDEEEVPAIPVMAPSRPLVEPMARTA